MFSIESVALLNSENNISFSIFIQGRVTNCKKEGGKRMSYRQVEKVLFANGWLLVRTKGSHCQFKHEATKKTTTVPYHGSKDIAIGTLKSIEKQTGLSLR